MRSNDLQPTRLDRARFKVLDLVAARTGSRTALIAYAGSAHIVLPPSTDVEVLKPLLQSLDPAIMPSPGAQASRALPLAQRLLGEQAAAGTLLFVNDGFDSGDVPELVAFAAEPGAPAMAALVVGTDEGGVAFMPDGSPVMASGGGRLDTSINASLLRRVASEAGVSVVRFDSGDADLRQLRRIIQSNLQLADDPDAEWEDQAWWLLWPAALLSLLWFRRGWTMQW
jgi:Ca-activated chloride channel family protein